MYEEITEPICALSQTDVKALFPHAPSTPYVGRDFIEGKLRPLRPAGWYSTRNWSPPIK